MKNALHEPAQGIYFFGADEANRTPDLLITNQLLYQLSYISEAAYFTNKSATAVSAKAVSP